MNEGSSDVRLHKKLVHTCRSTVVQRLVLGAPLSLLSPTPLEIRLRNADALQGQSPK